MCIRDRAFCDRQYSPDGTLASRADAGALIRDADEAAERAVRLGRDHEVETTDGSILGLSPSTLCVHGDAPGAASLASTCLLYTSRCV